MGVAHFVCPYGLKLFISTELNCKTHESFYIIFETGLLHSSCSWWNFSMSV